MKAKKTKRIPLTHLPTIKRLPGESEDTVKERARIIQWLNDRALLTKHEFENTPIDIAPHTHLLYAVNMLQLAARDLKFGKEP